MKQILFGLVIALMLCTYNVFSEQYSKVATEVTCVYKYSTDVFVDSAGHTTFMDDYTKLKFDNFSLEEPKVGKEDREYRRYASYRLCFKWNLQESIPKNAKVTGVSLEC